MTEKKTLVILPGWGGSHETWKDFIALASTKFAVVCIDLPCFGDEPCPDKVWNVEDYATFVSQKINSELRTPNSELILLGHSFGGQVAVVLASKHPELIDKLILSGAAVIRPNKIFRRLLFGTIAKFGKLLFKLPFLEKFDVLARKILYKTADSPDYKATAGTKRNIYKKIIRNDLRKSLPDLKMPTLVTWGTRDNMTPIRHGTKIARLLPNSKMAVFPGGHNLHNELTKEYLTVIEQFIELEK
jgi:pimeloyl-ACP methyl ester carboxylesterase